jgi:hypothetical protein
MRLPARRVTTGVSRAMSEPAYWKLVFPTFDSEKVSLPENAIPCTGRNVLADPAFTGGEWIRKYPLAVEEGEILLGSGGDRIKVLWLRTHRFPDGTEAGPIAMVRAKEDSAEVYAVGVYRGITKRPYFQLERIGPEVVATVSDEGCTGNTKVEPCKSMVSVYLPRKGELVRLTTFASERRDYVVAGEPGVYGAHIEYHLQTAPRYVPEGIKLYEQVKATDEAGRELRKAEVERDFVLRDVTLVPNEGPLWPRIFPKPTNEKEDAAPPKSADGAGRTGALKPKYGCCDDDLRVTPAPKSAPCAACARAPLAP